MIEESGYLKGTTYAFRFNFKEVAVVFESESESLMTVLVNLIVMPLLTALFLNTSSDASYRFI